MSEWRKMEAADPGLFDRLRGLGAAEACVRFGIGTEEGWRVRIPAARMALRGRLRVEPGVDRFALELPGWEAGDIAWFARRRGRGRPDYWQGAIEYRAEEHPALVFYFTAPLEELEIRVGAPEHAAG